MESLQHAKPMTIPYVEDEIISRDIHLSFAVALDDGLQMPVIKKAELMGVRELTAEATRLIEQARQGTLAADDIMGGQFHCLQYRDVRG